ncbi:MAG TPA: MYG1 family protein [Candidatus Paceibacterota bacterium]|mgnify:CR=1 FL=1|jgi:uncharacterized UPF0160 family protein|nr:metal-dependent hydrolase [Parcubacteria group bacterium]MDP6119731.1 MYG1 family protein [Candidatus Paceibacterota bacterium]HJN62946.1 MYG1 family protein [Candidatus Paceibacterota bacterium]|tara:strand:- start:14168 stop:15082 length:915 start_codon:yes stop_codon:yes gene_type:complete
MNKIVTHNAGFHTDDVFAVATLMLLLNDEAEVIRTRDEEIIKTGDYVVDVGLIYDEEKNRFDHHQKGGASKRENGIPYASFGLVWKKFGEELCGSGDVAIDIEKNIAQGIDALDNGFNISKSLIPNVFIYNIWGVIGTYEPTWKELNNVNIDDKFLEAVDFAKRILKIEIKKTKDRLEAEEAIRERYNNSEDKRLIVLGHKDMYGRVITSNTLIDFPEPLYVVLRKDISYRNYVQAWQVVAINKSRGDFTFRKPLPENWRGLPSEELIKETGVEDVTFCHNNGLMCMAGSKEGAIKLAKLALEA